MELGFFLWPTSPTDSNFFFQPRRHYYKLKDVIARSEEASEMAQKQAARFDLLLPEDAG